MRGPTQGTAIKVYESLAWLDEVKRVAVMLAAMDVDPLGIEYAGDRANGIVIDHRFADSWLVSFRPTGPGRQGKRDGCACQDTARLTASRIHHTRQAGNRSRSRASSTSRTFSGRPSSRSITVPSFNSLPSVTEGRGRIVTESYRIGPSRPVLTHRKQPYDGYTVRGG